MPGLWRAGQPAPPEPGPGVAADHPGAGPRRPGRAGRRRGGRACPGGAVELRARLGERRRPAGHARRGWRHGRGFGRPVRPAGAAAARPRACGLGRDRRARRTALALVVRAPPGPPDRRARRRVRGRGAQRAARRAGPARARHRAFPRRGRGLRLSCGLPECRTGRRCWPAGHLIMFLSFCASSDPQLAVRHRPACARTREPAQSGEFPPLFFLSLSESRSVSSPPPNTKLALSTP
mmetsp:Transcript_8685/g.27748  ORF Transcript_8685/g.27748 Transcript_8685/m.27748 type:complete len:236 (-) Transcript_8685:38-745(-)